MAPSTPVLIEDREITLSNLDKTLWPEDGLTKGDLIRYYTDIAPFLLPHLKERPLVFTRYPDGIHGKSFYQKNAPPYLPPWIPTWAWKGEERVINFILAGERATLAWVANQGCIEIHPWLSRRSRIEYPDFAVFDLDPSEGNTFEQVVKIALVLKQLLDELKLESYPKTSGAGGLHVYVPVINKYTYDQIRRFGERVAAMVSQALPEIATVERRVRLRGTRVYVDYLQNVIGKTLCAPYSVRPRPGATVSAPLLWPEITEVTPSQFTIKSILGRVEKCGDLFLPVLSRKQDLGPALARLGIRI